MKDDLISRRYLIEAFKEEFYYMYSDNFKFMLNWFENLPAVDSFKFCDQLWKIAYEHGKRDAQRDIVQQDIVHCKDCRWWRAPDDGCNHWDGMVTAPVNGFCSCGERKSDG